MIVPKAVSEPPLVDRLFALRQTIAPTLNDGELELFAAIAERKNLDPFSGQIVAVKRNTNRGARVTYQTGIDGYRSIAERTGEYRGSDEPEFGPACDCGARPTGHPVWARVVVHRRIGPDDYIHQPAKVKWHEYVPSDGFMWGDKPEVMLGKCAEAKALRIAFPWVFGDLYIREEMARQVDDDEDPADPPAVSARAAVAAKAAKLRGDDDPVDPPPSTPVDIAALESHAEDIKATEEVLDELVDAGLMEVVEEVTLLTPLQFAARLKAAGIPVADAQRVSEELFPGLASKDLTPAQWGAIWDVLDDPGPDPYEK